MTLLKHLDTQCQEPHEMACFADTSMLLETKLPKTYAHPRSTCEPAVTYTTKNRVYQILEHKRKVDPLPTQFF